MRFLDKLFNWYFKRSSLPYWMILILDCVIIYCSAFFVYWLHNRGAHTQQHFYTLSYVMFLYLLVCVVNFRIFRTYSGIIRYSSFVDLQRVAYANALSMVVCWMLHYGIKALHFRKLEDLSSMQILLIFIIATMLMWALRVLVKIIYDVTTSDTRARKTLIFGIGDAGVALAKNIRSQRPTKYILRGFISPEEKKNAHLLLGVRVYNTNELDGVLKKQDIDAVLVSPAQKTKFRNNPELQDKLIAAGLKIFMAEEHVWESTDGSTEEERPGQSMVLKEVEVEDLLPRDEIKVDLESVGQELTGKRILITGSAGSIGSEIVRQVAQFRPAAMMLIDQAETPEHDIRLMMQRQFHDIKAETVVTSICNPIRMDCLFNDFRPDYVFHAAAYKHVPMMEDNPGEAVHNNVYGTRIIADLSAKYGVKKFVMVSTDKAVNPTNVMGCSKRICEIYVQSLDRHLKMQKWQKKSDEEITQFVTTRFGNVLGSNGSVIPLFREQIKQGGPVTVTDPNIIRFFMLIPEACKLVLEAGTKGNGGEIFVFDMGKPVRIADLAKRMIRLSGAKNIEIKYTGLRPGEKLYEEVLNELEGTKPTFHQKIRIASVREYDYDEVCRDIDELIALAHKYDDMDIVRKMKQIVPEFKSNNSKYEVLD